VEASTANNWAVYVDTDTASAGWTEQYIIMLTLPDLAGLPEIVTTTV
jgi:hypothetical protein